MQRTLFIFSLVLISFFAGTVPAQAEGTAQFQFQPIVSVPLPTGGAVGATTSLTDYLNGVFVLAIAVATILGVVMITFDGIRYMTSDAIGKKQAAVEGLQGAAMGLILLLLSYVILNVINPQILNIQVLTQDITGLGGDSFGGLTPLGGTTATGASGALNPSALPSGTDLRAYNGTLSAGCTLTCWLDNAFSAPTGGVCATGDAVQSCPASATPAPASPTTPASTPPTSVAPTPPRTQPTASTVVQYGWRGEFVKPDGGKITKQAGPFSNSSQCDASLTDFLNKNSTLTLTSNFPCNCGQALSTQSACSSIR